MATVHSHQPAGPAWRRLAQALWLATLPALAPAAPADTTLEAQGAYVALAADCAAFHSQPGHAPYSGGPALVSKFGKLYGPNITPHPQAGIGQWTEADFERALRRGVAKGGELLYPAMPYDHYTRMSDEDVHALWAYLRSLPQSPDKSQANDLGFPFNLRRGLALWQSAYFHAGRQPQDSGQGADWNRGAYLVDALGHCGACHTPRNLAQASDANRRLAGATVEGWYAPDISGGPGSSLRTVSVDALAATLKSGRSAGNGKTFGPMQTVVHDSLSRLTDADVHAMAVYLKNQPVADQKQPAQAADALAADRFEAGRGLYELHCSQCHQSDGRGLTAKAPALAGNSGTTAREPHSVVSALLEGFDAQGTWVAMPSYATVLDDAQLADLSNYVRRAWGNRGARLASKDMVQQLRDVASIPGDGRRAALACPEIDAALLRPALQPGPLAVQQAAGDDAALRRLVRGYQHARPDATAGQVVQALSTAYCRAVVAGGASASTAGFQLAEFSQQLASVLLARRRGPPDRP